MRRAVAAALISMAVACGGTSPTGPSPSNPPVTAPATGTFVLSGRVVDATSAAGVAAARVHFITGINAGRLAVTGSDGTYTLGELRAGSGTLRVTPLSHAVVERALTIAANVTADFTVTAAAPPDLRAPYTYTGSIWDSRGAAVSGAAVTMIRESGASPLGIVTSGADGSYTISVQSTADSVRVTRDGYVRTEHRAPPPREAVTLINVTIPRIVEYVVQPLAALRVGETAVVQTVVTTDDGLRGTGRYYSAVSSSNEGVVAVVSREAGSLLARAPGTASVTATYSGVAAAANVTVVQ